MGFGSIMFGGGGRPKPSGVEQQSKEGVLAGFGNYFGAPNTGMKGDTSTFDWSQSSIGKQPTVAEANQGYDYNPMDTAMEGFRKPKLFSFSGLPDKYYQNEYNLGAKDLRRDAASQLFGLNQAVGNRRPGLLAKMGSVSGRNLGESLAGMRTRLGQEAMREKTDLGVKEQSMNADEMFRNMQALATTGQSKVGTQAGITQQKMADMMNMLQMFQNLYNTQLTSRRGMANDKSGGLLGGIARIGSTVAGGFLPMMGGVQGTGGGGGGQVAPKA